MTIKAIIFDVDGTLADTEDGHRKSFNKAFAECGLDWNWDVELYDKLLTITGGKERMRHYAERYAPDIAARPDLDALIKAIAANAQSGDQVLVMSNGGFGGIHEKLLKQLGAH